MQNMDLTWNIGPQKMAYIPSQVLLLMSYIPYIVIFTGPILEYRSNILFFLKLTELFIEIENSTWKEKKLHDISTEKPTRKKFRPKNLPKKKFDQKTYRKKFDQKPTGKKIRPKNLPKKIIIVDISVDFFFSVGFWVKIYFAVSLLVNIFFT